MNLTVIPVDPIGIKDLRYTILLGTRAVNDGSTAFTVSTPYDELPGLDVPTWVGLVDQFAETVRAAVDLAYTGSKDVTLLRSFDLTDNTSANEVDITP